MNIRLIRRIAPLLAACSLLLVSGCGESDAPSSQSYALTGTWLDVAGNGSETTVMLVQIEQEVDGVLFSADGWSGIVDGKINGDVLSLTYIYADGYTVYNEAQLHEDRLEGTFWSNDGRNGTWVATPLPDGGTGTATFSGNINSFETDDAATLQAAVKCDGGIVAHLYGPVCRSTTVNADGSFVFTDLPNGKYAFGFKCGGQTVTYRSASGQVLTMELDSDDQVELSEIKVSGGHINIGTIKVNVTDNPEPTPTPKPKPSPKPKPTPIPDPTPVPDPIDIPFTTVGAALGGPQANLVVRSEDEWDDLWNARGMGTRPEIDVDFSTEMMIVVTMGSWPNGCYRTEISDVTLYEGIITVEYTESYPSGEDACTDAMVSPRHLVKIARSDAPVVFHALDLVPDKWPRPDIEPPNRSISPPLRSAQP